MATKTLARRVQDLLPELYTPILEMVLEPAIKTSQGRKQHIDSSYTFPTAMHLTRAHREAFLEDYFTNTTFVFLGESLAKKFMSVLDKTSLEYMRNVRMIENVDFFDMMWYMQSLDAFVKALAVEKGTRVFDFDFELCERADYVEVVGEALTEKLPEQLTVFLIGSKGK